MILTVDLPELQGGACQPHQLAAALHIPDFPKTKEADIDGGGTTASLQSARRTEELAIFKGIFLKKLMNEKKERMNFMGQNILLYS